MPTQDTPIQVAPPPAAEEAGRVPVRGAKKAPVGKPSPLLIQARATLNYLGFLARFLPKPVRGPLLWIAATLLALGALSSLVGKTGTQVQQVVQAVAKSPIAFMVIGVVVAIVLVVGIWERVLARREKAHEHAQFSKKLHEFSKRPAVSESKEAEEDAELLLKDSAIVERIRKQQAQTIPRGGLGFESRIIAVVSGKGGVGKSLLSLGLLEDFSRDQPALLVDFDLHNRGLTSLLLDAFGQAPREYALPVLRSFLVEPSLERILKGYSSGMTPEQIDPLIEGLLLKFSGVNPRDPKRVITTLALKELPQKKVPLDDALKPQNAAFLPSIEPGGSFLGSRKVRDASEDAAFLFFWALSYRVRVANGIQNIIVDCHGAHDLYSVGLIRAATDLVIVTTPEMGSLDGTNELVRFGQQVTNAGGNRLPRSVLVVNRCLEEDPNAKQLAQEWKGNLTGGVIRIARNEEVEHIARNYAFGSVASHGAFWEHVHEIRTSLEVGR